MILPNEMIYNKYKLFILPCAGGCSFTYAGWVSFNQYIDVVPVEYPGHWSRFKENLSKDYNDLIQDVFLRICDAVKGDSPVILMGHSMGAIVAYDMARLLWESGRKIYRLVLVSCPPPTETCKKIQLYNDEDIKKFLRAIRQIPESVLDSEFFNVNLLPPVRNDFKLLKEISVKWEQGEEIPIDTICICGDKDPLVNIKDMYGWKKLIRGRISYKLYSGDHFITYTAGFAEYLFSLITGCGKI